MSHTIIICSECGNQMPTSAQFCNHCGQEQPQMPFVSPKAQREKSGAKRIAMLLAILAFVVVAVFGVTRFFGRNNTPMAVAERYGDAIMEQDIDLYLDCFHKEWFKLLCERTDLSAAEYKQNLSSTLMYTSLPLTDFHAIGALPATDGAASYYIRVLEEHDYTVSDAQYVTCSMKLTTGESELLDLLIVKVKGKWYLSPEYLDIYAYMDI